jgi:hypothetical protein
VFIDLGINVCHQFVSSHFRLYFPLYFFHVDFLSKNTLYAPQLFCFIVLCILLSSILLYYYSYPISVLKLPFSSSTLKQVNFCLYFFICFSVSSISFWDYGPVNFYCSLFAMDYFSRMDSPPVFCWAVSCNFIFVLCLQCPNSLLSANIMLLFLLFSINKDI